MRNSLVVILLVLISANYADLCTIDKEKICSSKAKNSNSLNHNYTITGNGSYSANFNYNHTDLNINAHHPKDNWDHISYVDIADNIEEYYMNKWRKEAGLDESDNTGDIYRYASPEEFSTGELLLNNEKTRSEVESSNNSNAKNKGRFLTKLLNFMELYHDYQLQEIYDV